MRENESDRGDGWPAPQDYISPWAARGEGEAGQDTIAFGGLAGEAGGPGQGSYVQRGNLDPWYGGDRDESRYGSYAGPGPGGGYGSAGGHGAGGGHGSAGGPAGATLPAGVGSRRRRDGAGAAGTCSST